MLPRAVLRDLAGKPEAQERALNAATELLLRRFEGLAVERPAPHPGMDFGLMID